jgi:hypothetical protein
MTVALREHLTRSPWRRTRLAAWAAVVLAATAHALESQEGASGAAAIPTITVERAHYILFPQQELKIPFDISIPGNVPFTVTGMSKTCRCLEVDALPQTLEAGATYRLAISTVGFRTPGSMNGEVVIDGTIGAQPQRIACVFSGMVHDYATWPTPHPLFDLGEKQTAELPARWTFTIGRGSHPQAWDRLSVAVVGGEHALSAAISSADGRAWTLIVTARPTEFCGVLSGRLRFTFAEGAEELPYHPERAMRLAIAGMACAHPASVLIGGLRLGTQLDRMVRLSRPDGSALKARTVRSSDPARVDCSLADEGESVLVHATAMRPLGDANGYMDIECDEHLMLRVPYLMTVAAEADAASP